MIKQPMADMNQAIRRLFGMKTEDPATVPKFMLLVALAMGAFVVIVSPGKTLALAVALLVTVLVVWRPEAIILLLAAYIPFEPFALKFVSDDFYIYARYASEFLVYALVLSVLVRLAMRRRKWVPTPLDLPFAFFLLVALSSLVLNAVPIFTGILGLRQIIRFILLFFVIVYLNPKEDFTKRLSVLMLAIAALQGVIGTVQAAFGGRLDEFLLPNEQRFYEGIQLTSGTNQFWDEGTRVFATMGRYDQLGTFLCFFMLLAVGWYYQYQNAQRRRYLLILVAVMAPALLLSLSRASWFGFIFGLLLLGAWLKKDMRIRLAFVGLAIAAVAYLGFSGLVVRYMTDYAGQTPVERFFEAFSFERWRGEYYGLGRLFWMVQTPRIVVLSAPLFGVGPGQYGGGAVAALGNTTVYERLNLPYGVYGSEGYIDNNWFSLWGETGTLGLFFYLWMFVALAAVAYRTWRQAKSEFIQGLALGFLGCLLAVTFQAFLATYLEVRTLAIYFWLYAGLLFVAARREKIYG